MMDFFINEIIEDERVKTLLLKDTETSAKAKGIAEEYLSGGEEPQLEAGLLPIFVLGQMADHTLAMNNARGIAKEVTVATLKDINLWIGNYELQHGVLGLAEFHWLTKHYTGRLFRLGRLQFIHEPARYGVPEGDVVLDTHIPQDEPLTQEACLASFAWAKEFFAEHFPEKEPKYFTCGSWLLNPQLADLLGEDANITKFMRLWSNHHVVASSSTQAIQRVFGLGFKAENMANAPEKTSLQRKLKAHFLAGGDLMGTGGYRKI